MGVNHNNPDLPASDFNFLALSKRNVEKGEPVSPSNLISGNRNNEKMI